MLVDRLRSLVKRPEPHKPNQASQEPVLPLNLSSEQLGQLQSLQRVPAWRHYQSALAELYRIEAGKLHRPLDYNDYLHQTGVCKALEKTITLIDDLTLQAQEYERIRTARAAEPEPSKSFSDLAFLGSAYWDAHRKRANHYGPR